MDIVILIAVMALSYWCYKSGKHEGNRQGYRAGRRRCHTA
jgi:hypothetical protein